MGSTVSLGECRTVLLFKFRNKPEIEISRKALVLYLVVNENQFKIFKLSRFLRPNLITAVYFLDGYQTTRCYIQSFQNELFDVSSTLFGCLAF